MFVCLELWQKHQYLLKETYLYLKEAQESIIEEKGQKSDKQNKQTQLGS